MAAFVGAGLGFFFGVALLSGDEAGRVNILFLLLLFVVVPILGIVLFAFSFPGRQISMHLRLNEMILFLGKSGRPQDPSQSYEMRRLLIIYHSQYGAVGWALGSIIALLVLLTFTDINFVWRSTLLSPENLLPILEWISLPWFFWEAAQPSTALLTATHDSRLVSHQTPNIAFSQWWPFILACQLFYTFLLRTVTMLLLRLNIQRKLNVATKTVTPPPQDRKTREKLPQKPIAEQLSKDFILVNWAGFAPEVIQQLDPAIKDKTLVTAGPLATDEDITALQNNTRSQLILVKSWEPPLEQLRDHLLHAKGQIAPIDVKSGRVQVPQAKHIEEWNRSISDMPDWSLYLVKDAI